MSLAVGAERRLRVVSGTLWLTTTVSRDAVSEDLWLVPGDELVLSRGSVWVLEARGEGEFQLLVPPQAHSWQLRWAALAALWRTLGRTVPIGQRA